MAQQSFQPFSEQGNFTQMHNIILDVVMPRLSGSAWKVLCFIIRKTKGYNKDQDRLSYSQIRAGTGITSDETVRNALKDLVNGEYVIAECGKSKYDPTTYSLNKHLTISTEIVSSTTKIEVGEKPTEIPLSKIVSSTTKIVEPPTIFDTPLTTEIEVEYYENRSMPTTEIEDTKEKKETLKDNKNMAHSRPLDKSIKDFYKEQLGLIEKGQAPLTVTGKKKTVNGVLAEMVADIWGQDVTPSAIGELGKEVGNAWEVYKFILSHAKDEFEGSAIRWLFGCAQNRPGRKGNPPGGNIDKSKYTGNGKFASIVTTTARPVSERPLPERGKSRVSELMAEAGKATQR